MFIHRLAQDFFLFCRPVFAVELQKDGRIGNGSFGFQDKNPEKFRCFINFFKHRIVQNGLYFSAVKNIAEGFFIGLNPGFQLRRNEIQFFIGVNYRFHMGRLPDLSERVFQDGEKFFSGINNFNSGSCLSRKRFVDNQNPVAVAK